MNLKNTLACVALAALVLPVGGLYAQNQPPKVEFPAASPASTVKQRVGITDITVEYSRPGIKDRKVFGGLVPHGEVWRTGANQATKITFSTAVKFGGVDVPAGTYALFSIPGDKEWSVILSKVTGQWGAYRYDKKDDVARATVAPVKLSEPVETFTINVNNIRDESATLDLVWDKIRVPVKLEFDLKPLAAQIEAVMASNEEKKPYAQAAMFYLDHGLDLKKAAAWMDEAIKAQPDAFYLIYRKGLILEKQGDKAGALAAAQKSLDMASKAEGGIREEYTRLNKDLIARLK